MALNEHHCEYKNLNGCLNHLNMFQEVAAVRGFRGNGCISVVPSAPSAVREWIALASRASLTRSAMRFSSVLVYIRVRMRLWRSLQSCCALWPVDGKSIIKMHKKLFTVFWRAHNNNIAHTHYRDISLLPKYRHMSTLNRIFGKGMLCEQNRTGQLVDCHTVRGSCVLQLHMYVSSVFWVFHVWFR